VGEIAKEQAFFQGSCCAKHPGWIQFQGRHSADLRVSQAGTHLTSHQNLRHTLCALTPCSCTAVDSTDFTSSPCYCVCCVCCHDCWPYIVSCRSRNRRGVRYATEHYYCLLCLTHADLIAVKVLDQLPDPRIPPCSSLDRFVPIEAARLCLPSVTPRETCRQPAMGLFPTL
jgi:hypothetical protein